MVLFIDGETEAFRGPSAGRRRDQDWSPHLHHGPSKHHRWQAVSALEESWGCAGRCALVSVQVLVWLPSGQGV